jgi:hypothetical protein
MNTQRRTSRGRSRNAALGTAHVVSSRSNAARKRRKVGRKLRPVGHEKPIVLQKPIAFFFITSEQARDVFAGLRVRAAHDDVYLNARARSGVLQHKRPVSASCPFATRFATHKSHETFARPGTLWS